MYGNQVLVYLRGKLPLKWRGWDCSPGAYFSSEPCRHQLVLVLQDQGAKHITTAPSACLAPGKGGGCQLGLGGVRQCWGLPSRPQDTASCVLLPPASILWDRLVIVLLVSSGPRGAAC